jgi:hypothetical protein
MTAPLRSAPQPSPRWSAFLTRPVRVKNGPTLRTLDDLRDFILNEPTALQERKPWQCACELLLAAAERDGDIGVVTEKIELALFLESRWLPARPLVLVQSVRDEKPVLSRPAAAPVPPPTDVPEPVRDMMRLGGHHHAASFVFARRQVSFLHG